MDTLQGLILYWRATLKQFRYLLEPSAITHIENTITYLCQLQKLLGGDQ